MSASAWTSGRLQISLTVSEDREIAARTIPRMNVTVRSFHGGRERKCGFAVDGAAFEGRAGPQPDRPQFFDSISILIPTTERTRPTAATPVVPAPRRVVPQ